MNKTWFDCKKILCIRPDNMGDLLMSTPAIRALKERFKCSITVLTSSMACGIAKNIPEIDEILVYDAPWIKTNEAGKKELYGVVAELRQKQFDAAVIFTVYSQNPVPSIMLAYLAEIPLRLAYCRENPYELLSHWVPDAEPYSFIQHQVKRDLALVASVGAFTKNDFLSLQTDTGFTASLENKTAREGIRLSDPWIILHAGVSEEKRKYPEPLWIETARALQEQFGLQVLFTGVGSEAEMLERLARQSGEKAFSLAGKLSLDEFLLLVKKAPLVISVNTGTIHIAAALRTPVIVLYALTNPQHAPWKVRGRVLPFEVPKELWSKNEVVRFVQNKMDSPDQNMVQPDEILKAVREVLFDHDRQLIPEMLFFRNFTEELL